MKILSSKKTNELDDSPVTAVLAEIDFLLQREITSERQSDEWGIRQFLYA